MEQNGVSRGSAVALGGQLIAKLFGWDQRDDWNSEFDNLMGLIDEGMQR